MTPWRSEEEYFTASELLSILRKQSHLTKIEVETFKEEEDGTRLRNQSEIVSSMVKRLRRVTEVLFRISPEDELAAELAARLFTQNCDAITRIIIRNRSLDNKIIPEHILATINENLLSAAIGNEVRHPFMVSAEATQLAAAHYSSLCTDLLLLRGHRLLNSDLRVIDQTQAFGAFESADTLPCSWRYPCPAC